MIKTLKIRSSVNRINDSYSYSSPILRPLYIRENSALMSIVFFPIWATCLVNNIYFILKVES